MRWSDTGIVLSQKILGEKGVILTVLTQNHGLYKGLARRSTKKTLPQPGTIAHVTWSARLQDHLGSWTVEPTYQPMALLLTQPLALNALSAACSLIEVAIPEREKSPGTFEALERYLFQAAREDWQQSYLLFERTLLKLMGYELQLNTCAATGSTEELAYISPKSGQAVSRSAGEPYKQRLFPLSVAFISSTFSLHDFHESLRTLSFFWDKYVLHPHGTSIPPARDRFLQSIERRAL